MGRVFLVSGAGSGIGRAIAIRLSQESHTVVLLGRSLDKLYQTRKDMDRRESHHIVVADMRQKFAIRNGMQGIGMTALDGIIANAGIGGENHYGDDDRWDDIIGTNLGGTYTLVNELLPLLGTDDAPYRHIVLISSILARLGVPGYTAYCASKAGLLGLMRSWAVGLAPRKILVNAVCPGWVATEMSEQGIQAFADRTGRTYDEALAEQMGSVPLRKMALPEEVARLVAFLVSESHTSVTGQVFDINNGALMP